MTIKGQATSYCRITIVASESNVEEDHFFKHLVKVYPGCQNCQGSRLLKAVFEKGIFLWSSTGAKILLLLLAGVLKDAVVDISVVPHEGGLEVVMVPMSVNDRQSGHAQQEPRESVKKVVVQVELRKGGAEREGEGNRAVKKKKEITMRLNRISMQNCLSTHRF